MSICRKPYLSDVSDEKWSLVAPYLLLQRADAKQREHDLREVFNGLRYIVKTGAPWRWMPNDLPPWAAVYQQTQRWLEAGCFEALVDDLRAVHRLAAGHKAEPTAAIIDSSRRRVRVRFATAPLRHEDGALSAGTPKRPCHPACPVSARATGQRRHRPRALASNAR